MSRVSFARSGHCEPETGTEGFRMARSSAFVTKSLSGEAKPKRRADDVLGLRRPLDGAPVDPIRRGVLIMPRLDAARVNPGASALTAERSPVLGSSVMATPAACASTICCTATAICVSRWPMPLSMRWAMARETGPAGPDPVEHGVDADSTRDRCGIM